MKPLNAALGQLTAARKAIGTDAKSNAISQARLQQLHFIAGRAGRGSFAAIASRENPGLLALSEKTLREPENHWRLAGAAGGDVSYADHHAIEAALP